MTQVGQVRTMLHIDRIHCWRRGMQRPIMARATENDWHMEFAASVDAHGRGDHDAGRVACESLLSRWNLPGEVRAATLRNSVMYTQRLTDLVPETDFIEVPVPTPRGQHAFNPSIYSSRHGLVMAARSTNWEFIWQRHYRVNAPDGVARSTSYLLRFGTELNLESVVLLVDETDRTGEVEAQFRGYHDLRLF